MYSWENVRGHIEVYYNGEFIFAADSLEEAMNDIEEHKKKTVHRKG